MLKLQKTPSADPYNKHKKTSYWTQRRFIMVLGTKKILKDVSNGSVVGGIRGAAYNMGTKKDRSLGNKSAGLLDPRALPGLEDTAKTVHFLKFGHFFLSENISIPCSKLASYQI